MDIKETWCEGLDWIHLAQNKTRACSSEHGNEFSYCQFLNKDFAPRSQSLRQSVATSVSRYVSQSLRQ